MKKLCLFILSCMLVVGYYDCKGMLYYKDYNSEFVNELVDELNIILDELHQLVDGIEDTTFYVDYSDTDDELKVVEGDTTYVSADFRLYNEDEDEPELIPLSKSNNLEYGGDVQGVDCTYNHEVIEVSFNNFNGMYLGYNSTDKNVFSIRDEDDNLVVVGYISGRYHLMDDVIYQVKDIKFEFIGTDYSSFAFNIDGANSSVLMYYHNKDARTIFEREWTDDSLFINKEINQELVDILSNLSFELVKNDEITDDWSTDFNITDETTKLEFDDYTFMYNPVLGYELYNPYSSPEYGYIHLTNESVNKTVSFYDSSTDIVETAEFEVHNNRYAINEYSGVYWLTIDFDGVYDNYAIDFQKDDGFTIDDIHKFASSVEIQPK